MPSLLLLLRLLERLLRRLHRGGLLLLLRRLLQHYRLQKLLCPAVLCGKLHR
jgi:hypothetical protein